MPAIRVSIVEDDAETRAAWRLWLKQSPDFVCSAEFASGEDALLGWNKKLADVALVDLRMPGMGGAECIRRLKERFPQLRCLVVTVVHDSQSIFEGLQAGADGYLLKSASPKELMVAVADILNGGAPMSAAIARKVIQFFHHRGHRASREPNLRSLTVRELEVLARISRGASNKQIADELGLTVHTIKAHAAQIYDKLHVMNRAQAAVLFKDSTLT